MYPDNPATTQCSVVTVDPRVEPVTVIETIKCSILPESEMAVQVKADHAPAEINLLQLLKQTLQC